MEAAGASSARYVFPVSGQEDTEVCGVGCLFMWRVRVAAAPQEGGERKLSGWAGRRPGELL